jgi:urease accessory protein UreF
LVLADVPGLEAAAERGKVYDRGSLQRWIAAVLAHGAGRIDADILREAHRAALAADLEALAVTNGLTRDSGAFGGAVFAVDPRLDGPRDPV